MVQRTQPHLAALLFLAVAMTIVLLSAGCRHHSKPGESEGEADLRGEPDQYSATIVRTVYERETQGTTISHEARSGEQCREEWIEQGHNRALIWRPDLGKCYLLDLDQLVFVEISLDENSDNLPDQSRLHDRAAGDSAS